MTKFEERFEENIEEEHIEIEPEKKPIEIESEEEPIKNEPKEEPIKIEPEKEPIEIKPEEEPIEIEPEEEPIENEPEEEPIEIEPEKEPIEIEPEEEPIEIEPEEEPIENEPKEEPIEIEHEEEPIEVEPKEEPEEEPLEIEPQEEPVEIKPGEIDMTNLYVSNFPHSLDCEDLKELFSKFGPIAKIYVDMDQDSGLNNGYGFVKFTDAVHAAAAINKMKGHIIMGMQMLVNIKGARPPPGNGNEVNKAKLFVEHLPLDVTRVRLIKMFQDFGSIAKAYVVKDKSMLNKVYGYVIFENVDSASKAMAEMNGREIGANKLRVSVALDTQYAKENINALRSPDHGHVREKAYRPPEDEDEDLPGYRKMYRRQ